MNASLALPPIRGDLKLKDRRETNSKIEKLKK